MWCGGLGGGFVGQSNCDPQSTILTNHTPHTPKTNTSQSNTPPFLFPLTNHLQTLPPTTAWREAEGQTAEQATKIQALRRVFHRAVLVPVDNLDELWRVRCTLVLF
jgi:hypothetical protein